MKLVLASKSPRRQEMLKRQGVEFEVDSAEVDETFDPAAEIEQQILDLARKKAGAVSVRHPGAAVLGADTIVVLTEDGVRRVVVGKPRDAAEAEAILQRLSGETHQVFTAYALLLPDGSRRERLVRTSVRFAKLDPETIRRYVESGEPLDKAGAYGIQGGAEAFVESLSGSYTNVVGLPLAEVLRDLKEAGVWLPQTA